MKRAAFAAAAGGIAALGQAPFDLALLCFVGMCAAFWMFCRAETPRRAALIGWSFGAGYFAVALHWIMSPFMVDAARHGWMAPFAVVLLSGGLALFWGLSFWAARKVSPRAWALVLIWAGAELLRGYIFTGFPWAMPAQVTVDVMAGQALAWAGPYLLNMLMMAGAAALMWRGLPARARAAQGILALGVIAVMVLPPVLPGDAPLTGQVLRLIQPNVPQHEKWDREKIHAFYARQLDLTQAEAEQPLAAVIWPETAIPWALDLAGMALEEISASAEGTPVVLGVQRRSDLRYFNSLVVLEDGGEVSQQYDKHHLVPFGEYMPLGDLMGSLGISGLAAREGQGYSSGPGPALLDMGELGKVLPLICYEAVFPHDVGGTSERPDWMVQVTNDAWFGPAAGPRQHLAQARMRAIEQGLPLARSANTGISAMIDPWGRITAALPMGQAGFLDVALPKPRPATLYSRTGDAPFALLLALLSAWVAYRLWRNSD